MKFVKYFLLLVFFAALSFAYARFDGYRGTVDAVKPERMPAVEAVYATGTVEPSVMVPVAPRIAARLQSLLADEGKNVIKGEVLAELEAGELQEAVNDARASLTLAEQEFNRKIALVKKEIFAKDVADQAQANLHSARAKLAQAEVALSYARLVAPENGMVIRRDGEIGEMITANQPVFYLSCCAGLRIAAEVDEEDIARVSPGQKALIRADAFPGRVFEGSVTSITPKGDPVSRSYRVRISLPETTPLMIGMTAESNIILAEKNSALMIPVGSLDGDNVYVQRAGIFQPVSVRAGMRTDSAIEILDGLTENDVIAANADAMKANTDLRRLPAQVRSWHQDRVPEQE